MPKCQIPLSKCSTPSSQIREFGYDPASGTLAIRFNGKGGDRFVYTYSSVPQDLYDGLKAADADPEQSTGKFFGERIKGNPDYPHTKIDEQEHEPPHEHVGASGTRAAPDLAPAPQGKSAP